MFCKTIVTSSPLSTLEVAVEACARVCLGMCVGADTPTRIWCHRKASSTEAVKTLGGLRPPIRFLLWWADHMDADTHPDMQKGRLLAIFCVNEKTEYA